jgi:hypothetical protein
MSTIRYCVNGHWDDPGEPPYFATRRPQLIQQRRAAAALRLLRVKFCETCGAELISECIQLWILLEPRFGRWSASALCPLRE